MKLISLNIWGGRIYEPFINFIKQYSEETDIFCFQEVFSYKEPIVSRETRLNILEKLQEILPGHQVFFTLVQDNIDTEGEIEIPSKSGKAIFARQGLEFQSKGYKFLSNGFNTFKNDDFGTLGISFQYLETKNKERPLMVINVHGQPFPGDKLDTPERLAQSRKIKDFVKDFKGQKIICGDFNLMPETESVKILEENMKNLIKDFRITDTRGAISARKYLGEQPVQKFANYAFVSKDIKVISFKVPKVEISDHLPLILEFS